MEGAATDCNRHHLRGRKWRRPDGDEDGVLVVSLRAPREIGSRARLPPRRQPRRRRRPAALSKEIPLDNGARVEPRASDKLEPARHLGVLGHAAAATEEDDEAARRC